MVAPFQLALLIRILSKLPHLVDLIQHPKSNLLFVTHFKELIFFSCAHINRVMYNILKSGKQIKSIIVINLSHILTVKLQIR